MTKQDSLIAKQNFDISIVITTFNENEYLDHLLLDLQKVDFFGLTFEILLLEAGEYKSERAKQHLGDVSRHLHFISLPKATRTQSLNYLFNIAKGNLIIRLDGRTRIDKCYIKCILDLSKETGADNVGGVMIPFGRNQDQRLVAKLMQHPFSFGGAKSRNPNFKGSVDSVYLGAFKRESLKKIHGELFDSIHPQISEDSDLNFRIRKTGGLVYIDASIKVYYAARENLHHFYKLCYNYGVARGLFVLKNKQFSAYRQTIPPISVIFAFMLFVFGFQYDFLHKTLIGIFIIYFVILLIVSKNIADDLEASIKKVFFGFVGCHFFWTYGFFKSPIIFLSNLRKY